MSGTAALALEIRVRRRTDLPRLLVDRLGLASGASEEIVHFGGAALDGVLKVGGLLGSVASYNGDAFRTKAKSNPGCSGYRNRSTCPSWKIRLKDLNEFSFEMFNLVRFPSFISIATEIFKPNSKIA